MLSYTRYNEQLSAIPSHRRVVLDSSMPAFDPFITDEMAQYTRLVGFIQTTSFLRFGCELVLYDSHLRVHQGAHHAGSVSFDITTNDAEEPPQRMHHQSLFQTHIRLHEKEDENRDHNHEDLSAAPAPGAMRRLRHSHGRRHFVEERRVIHERIPSYRAEDPDLARRR